MKNRIRKFITEHEDAFIATAKYADAVVLAVIGIACVHVLKTTNDQRPIAVEHYTDNETGADITLVLMRNLNEASFVKYPTEK